MSILICGITTADAYKNKRRLKVRMADDGSLSYHLKSYTGSTSFAISNMALKRPLPEMREDTLKATMDVILSVLREARVEILDTDMYAFPAAPQWQPPGPWAKHPDHSPEDCREEVWTRETRQSYVEWVNTRIAGGVE